MRRKVSGAAAVTVCPWLLYRAGGAALHKHSTNAEPLRLGKRRHEAHVECEVLCVTPHVCVKTFQNRTTPLREIRTLHTSCFAIVSSTFCLAAHRAVDVLRQCMQRANGEHFKLARQTSPLPS
jgi:hypothetical protein